MRIDEGFRFALLRGNMATIYYAENKGSDFEALAEKSIDMMAHRVIDEIRKHNELNSLAVLQLPIA
jgi:hypothetical protein